jgi:hypothetical protein
MSSVKQQLSIRVKLLEYERLKRILLSGVFSQWRLYKRFYEQLVVIQRFMRSFRYIVKMRFLKKNHREPDSTTHTAQEIDQFIRMEQNRELAIGMSRDLKNDNWIRIRIFITVFVKTHSPVVNEQPFTQKMSERLSPKEFNIIKLAHGQTFIDVFNSVRKSREESYDGCITIIRSTQLYGIDLLWLLYYLSYERLPKSWFPNPESDFEVVFEELKSFLGRMIPQSEEEEEEEDAESRHAGLPEQPDYFPEPCPQCGCETIQGMCFDEECTRMRESACPACGNPIEGSNAVEVDGMRLHVDCANYNQHNSDFNNHTEYFGCNCSSNDKTFVKGFGFFCHQCISDNQ